VARQTPRRVGKSRQRLNALNAKDRIVGAATFVLLVSFWLFLAELDSVVLVLYVLIVAFGVGDLAAQGRLSKEQLLALITGVNMALVVLGFLLKPAGSSWSYGAFLALAASIVAFLPFGLPIIEARRRH
jgi:hypothetical protein